MAKVTVRVFRGDVNGGEMVPYQVETFPGMVLLDAIHQIQAEQDPRSPAAGTVRQPNAARAARRSTAGRNCSARRRR